MKTCKKCGQPKHRSEFNKESRRPDGLQVYCRVCQRARCRVHYNENSQAIAGKQTVRKKVLQDAINSIKIKSRCLVCGESDPCCLDFHHRSNKEFSISDAVKRKMSLENILKEIAKCTVVCSNCHRKIHSGSVCLLVWATDFKSVVRSE